MEDFDAKFDSLRSMHECQELEHHFEQFWSRRCYMRVYIHVSVACGHSHQPLRKMLAGRQVSGRGEDVMQILLGRQQVEP